MVLPNLTHIIYTYIDVRITLCVLVFTSARVSPQQNLSFVRAYTGAVKETFSKQKTQNLLAV
jgi:hypothetical protein